MEKCVVVKSRSVGIVKNAQRWRLIKRKKQVLNCCMGLVFTVAMGATAGSSYALDSNALPDCAGAPCTGTHSVSGNVLDVNVGSYSKFNYNTYNIGSASTVNLNGAAGSVYVAKINGANGASEIFGSLNGAGITAFLMNTAGITFGAGSHVNLGSLVASTASDVDINNGKYKFTAFGDAAVVNNGDVKVSNGGFAVLAAPKVENNGTIVANLGRIELASTDNLFIDTSNPATAENIAAGIPTLDFRGDDLITYSASNINTELPNLGVTNTGTLQAQSGLVKISAKAGSGAIDSVVNLNGIVDVNPFGQDADAGKVLVSSTVGDINVGATINAESSLQNSAGGKVEITSTKRVNVNSHAIIKASGGSRTGDEGSVKITARNLVFNGYVEALIRNLYDGATLTLNQTGPDALHIYDGIASDDDNNVIYESVLENILQNGTNVLVATGNASLPSIVDNSLVLSGSIILDNLGDSELTGGKGNLTLISNTISFADKNDTIASTSGNTTLISGSGGIDIGSIITNSREDLLAGEIGLFSTNGGDIKTYGLSVINYDSAPLGGDGYGHINVISDGNVEINGDTKIVVGTDSAGFHSADAGLWIEAKKNIVINGNIDISSYVNGDGTPDAYDSAARAYIIALGDNTITGTVTVKASASDLGNSNVNSSAEFIALAGAEIVNSDNLKFSGPAQDTPLGKLTITGYTKVDSVASSSAGDVTSDATVLRAASGDVNVTGDSNVTSNATSNSNPNSDVKAKVMTLAGVSSIGDGTARNIVDAIYDNNFKLGNQGAINAQGFSNLTSMAGGHNAKALSSIIFASSKNTKITGNMNTYALTTSNLIANSTSEILLSAGKDALSGSELGNSGNLDITGGMVAIANTTTDASESSASAKVVLVASRDITHTNNGSFVDTLIAANSAFLMNQQSSVESVNGTEHASLQIESGSGNALFFNANGFSDAGYNANGFDVNGNYWRDASGYDYHGFNAGGHNVNGTDHDGAGFDVNGNYWRDANGYDYHGYNSFGYNSNGFNSQGHNSNGTDHDDTGFDANGNYWRDANGYDYKGFNLAGFNDKGFDKDGFDNKGFNLAGINRDTGTQYDANGFDRSGNRKPAEDDNSGRQTASVINSQINNITVAYTDAFKELARDNEPSAIENPASVSAVLSAQQLQNIAPAAGNISADRACNAMNCNEEEQKD